MRRCVPEQADLVLDSWAWRFTQLADAEAVRHKLAGYKGAIWPDWTVTHRRLTAAGTPGAPRTSQGRPRQEGFV